MTKTHKSLSEIKSDFTRKGWSYQRASLILGVSYVHICHVLNGKRNSPALLEKIDSLPVAERQTGKGNFNKPEQGKN
jgi:hypothetical protein